MLRWQWMSRRTASSARATGIPNRAELAGLCAAEVALPIKVIDARWGVYPGFCSQWLRIYHAAQRWPIEDPATLGWNQENCFYRATIRHSATPPACSSISTSIWKQNYVCELERLIAVTNNYRIVRHTLSAQPPGVAMFSGQQIRASDH
jgi:hypothetical protein